MELHSETKVYLKEKFRADQSRLAEFHTYAELEIKAALGDCLLLNPSLCSHASRCRDSVLEAAACLSEPRPLLLLSGQGALVTLAGFLGDQRDLGDVHDNDGTACGFGRLRGLLWVAHDPELQGQSARLRWRPKEPEGAVASAASPSVVGEARDFDHWTCAGRWLAERSPDKLDEVINGGADWELGLNCPDLCLLRVLVVPRLSRLTRTSLRQHLPGCALFLHHIAFPSAAAETEVDIEELEMELREAVEHCVLMRLDRANDIQMLHRRLHIYCRLPKGSEEPWRNQALDLVDAALRDFMPDSVERRRRILFGDGLGSGPEALNELLVEQLAHCTCDSLSQLLDDLGSLSRAVRGLQGSQQFAEVSSAEQRRTQNQYNGDLRSLKSSAEAAARSFQRSMDERLSELSVHIQDHLRRQEVKDRLAKAYVEHSFRHPHLEKGERELYLMERVAQELNDWNRETRIFVRIDREICELKAQYFQRLCHKARSIPELVALSSDSFSAPPPASWESGQNTDIGGSLTSRSVVGLSLMTIGGQQMRSSIMQRAAVGIGIPLIAPLVLITVAFIWPVTVLRGKKKSERQPLKQWSVKTLRDEAWDSLDKMGRLYINENFFGPARSCLKEDANKLGKFVETYCIVPLDLRVHSELKYDPKRLQGRLDEFFKRLQGIVAKAKLFGATELNFGMLRSDQCQRFGINCDVSEESQLGDRIGGGAFSTVFAIPPSGQQRHRLALKLVNAHYNSNALLEAEMMRELASDPHPNLLPGLGSVHFPNLMRIGLLMPRCDYNLRQLLQQHRQQLVPRAAITAGASFQACQQVLASCTRLYKQILAGVRHLHGRRILHRDLKLENVLADLPTGGGDPGAAMLRICDFGFAKAEELLSGGSIVGTPGYMAKELAPPRPKFTVKSDIYALGIMLWECYYGASAAKGVATMLLNGDCGLDFLIRLMTHDSPEERPHIEQCIAMLMLNDRNIDRQSIRLISYTDSLRTLNMDNSSN